MVEGKQQHFQCKIFIIYIINANRDNISQNEDFNWPRGFLWMANVILLLCVLLLFMYIA